MQGDSAEEETERLIEYFFVVESPAVESNSPRIIVRFPDTDHKTILFSELALLRNVCIFTK